jgi:hypothetical protein
VPRAFSVIKNAAIKPVIFCLLGISNLSIKILPFRILMRFFANSETEPEIELTGKNQARVGLIGRQVISVSKYTPWRSKCFEQALTAAFILKLLGISYKIYFGVNTENGPSSHAWVMVGEKNVTGQHTNVVFTPVKAFFYRSKKDRNKM